MTATTRLDAQSVTPREGLPLAGLIALFTADFNHPDRDLLTEPPTASIYLSAPAPVSASPTTMEGTS